MEQFVFWPGNIDRLSIIKQELINQMKVFDIMICGDGFFEINRSSLLSVREINRKQKNIPFGDWK